MKVFAKTILTILILFGLACENDFETAADWKEIAVIFGIMDQRDTAQYIIVQRAFLDREGNNLFGLAEPDSIFFTDDISVEISEIQNDQIIQTESLELVNGNDIGIIKDAGIFPQDPNWLYRYHRPLNFLNTYDLQIHNHSSGNEYHAATPIIQDFDIINQFGASGFNFSDDLENTISWFNADNAAVFQLKLQIVYTEKDTTVANSIHEGKMIERVLIRRLQPIEQSSTVTFSFDDEMFFNILSQEIPVDHKVERCFKHIHIIVTAGSQNLFRYIQAQQAQSGLTEFQIQPNFTNIEGNEALGIFASRTGTRLDSIHITAASIQAIVDNESTRALHFLPFSCN